MLRAYKYRIYPNDNQKVLLSKTFGCCRVVYNWALSKKMEAYKEDKTLFSCFDLINLMARELKNEKEWLNEVSAQSLQASLRDLDSAYKNFFRNTKSVGFPKFKSKIDKQSFHCPQHCSVNFKNKTISIPKIKNIPAKLDRAFRGKIKTVTISKSPSGKYYASVLVDTNISELPTKEIKIETSIGVDMGIKSLAVCSNGEVFENNKNLAKSTNRLVTLQRRLSKKKKGSSNGNKARLKLAILHEKIANQRKDNLHKITYRLTHESQVDTICIENLNVKGMTRNHHLAKSLNDASFGMFRTMLEYKCKWYGINLMVIDRFYPSSKTCSCCGNIYRDLKLSERGWTCSKCGSHHDRDLNAAINIRNTGIYALPTERRKVKAVESPTMDDRSAKNLRSSGSRKQQKLGGISANACVSRRV